MKEEGDSLIKDLCHLVFVCSTMLHDWQRSAVGGIYRSAYFELDQTEELWSKTFLKMLTIIGCCDCDIEGCEYCVLNRLAEKLTGTKLQGVEK